MGGQTAETLNYSVLADFYDRLVKDDEATRQWVAYTFSRVKGRSLLELACGSGEITLALANEGYQMSALDLSPEMIQRAKAKDTENKITFNVGNMLDLKNYGSYDAILCFCDSINYLNKADLDGLFQNIYLHLKQNGILLFDMHTPERLVEFEEPYIEEGWIDKTAYQWAIQSDQQRIIHHFRFYFADGHVASETHIQTVFELEEVRDMLEKIGFRVEITTDFEAGEKEAGEKYFICAQKGDRR